MLKRVLIGIAIVIGIALSPLLHPGYRLMFRAQMGDPQAMFDLGMEYEKLYGGVVRRDGYKSVYWLRKAADKGHPDACINLGLMMYSTPEGPMHWFLLGAERGDRRCMVEVANAYQAPYGLYVGYPHDQAKADYWWNRYKESKKPGEWW